MNHPDQHTLASTWGPSIQAAAQSTSYEDYLERMKPHQFEAYYYGPAEDPCPGCKAEWIDHEQAHAEGCEYLAWIDEHETERATCPNHGLQLVIRHYPSQGPDPYDIEVCACGCHLLWFSSNHVDVVKEGQS